MIRHTSIIWAIIISALTIRLLSLGAFPLLDTTEARYGEMARLMVETQNWITPLYDYDEPFWGKPPAFIWISAIGIKLFGVNEFGIRFFHWVASILVLLCCAKFAKQVKINPLASTVILVSTGLFLLASGAVIADMLLTLSLTIAMTSFYLCWCQNSQGNRRYFWGYVSFAGLALGLLTKGPITIVLMAIAVMPWLILQRGFIGAFKALWQRFPIVTGTLLMLAIALPWYILAEWKKPGFLDYFLMGEHVKRFIEPRWSSKYGRSHSYPRGHIWIFWFQAAIPWAFVLPIFAWLQRRQFADFSPQTKQLASFLLCWMLAALLFFSISSNILEVYVLPSLPAQALLLALLLPATQTQKFWFPATGSITVLTITGILIFFHFAADKRSDKILWQAADRSIKTFYIQNRPFSGQYYSRGQAKILTDEDDLSQFEQVQLIGKARLLALTIEKRHLDCKKIYTAENKRLLYLCNNRK